MLLFITSLKLALFRDLCKPFFKVYLLFPKKFLNNVQGANEGSSVLRVAYIAYCFSMNIDIV